MSKDGMAAQGPLDRGVRGLDLLLLVLCSNWSDHEWQKVGASRVPAHGSYYTNMPLKPTGTVEYEIFRCRYCGQETRQERLYSYRENEPRTARKQSRYDPTGLRHKPSN